MTMDEFLLMDPDGNLIQAHAAGSSLAFACKRCGHPVLASALAGQSGSDEQHPVTCKGCRTRHFLDVRIHTGKVYIQQLDVPR